ncbi:enoyl-CoA hydratase/isomerase family protein [Mycobacterium heidelbergense]|uniref:Enoyl-CoA hydratase n=1 Tax=Mycobacterium heidelbergense TaxID=53376 RepID=A0A1X0DQQ9_MYCHE|nr:enoyl-CoA hydratase/isomerase family protein [Mycobacterium heidelbergense]MCV7051972.1 enoyl-CoA hydratase/isomerase family protein [Mycobacterium heidelbergense]ORA74721.1 enoyl-CoA hydratase [Mycobacterium heidelbergense]BBZ51668.1 enoyl-CoA hydratase [Mycobacterium heidelbergense]
MTSDERVLFDVDPGKRIATITLNNPKQRNSYDAAMRDAIARCLDRVAADDDLTVVLLRGEGGVFSTGADMNNAYAWYGDRDAAAAQRRPSQRRRLTVDRNSFGFYHNFMGFPKVTVGEISGYALGGGFEMALMTDISVIARDTKIGMPATRFLGPALGSLHMFFHRLGPVLARRLLLTGDIIEAGAVEHLGIFTDTCAAEMVSARARYWAEKAAKMPADGVVIAKEAFRLVEQSQAYQGEEVASYLFHAFGTNLQFAPGEFNFVKARAEHGTKEAFRLRDEHFEVPEPESR